MEVSAFNLSSAMAVRSLFTAPFSASQRRVNIGHHALRGLVVTLQDAKNGLIEKTGAVAQIKRISRKMCIKIALVRQGHAHLPAAPVAFESFFSRPLIWPSTRACSL